jgi:hypothetical protein
MICWVRVARCTKVVWSIVAGMRTIRFGGGIY